MRRPSMRQAVNGSISIFLILVMVPLVSCTYLAVDSLRSSAGKARLEGALNLTGNAALNDYDQALKDIYGLFAMGKSQSTMETELAAVFSGVLDAGVDNYINTHTTEFSVTYPAEGALCRPAVMERTITDYMKYRAPYRYARGVSQRLGAFQSMKSAANALEKSQDYYDSLSGVSKQLEHMAEDLPEGNDTGSAKKEIDSLLGSLDKLSSKVSKTDKEAQNWKSALDAMEDGEAKGLLSGDYKNTAEVLSSDGVNKLKQQLEKDQKKLEAYEASLEQAKAEREAAEAAWKDAEEAVANGGDWPEGLTDPATIKDPDPLELSYKSNTLYGYIQNSKPKSGDGSSEGSTKSALETLAKTDRSLFTSDVPDQYVSRAVGATVAAAIDAVGSSAAADVATGGTDTKTLMSQLKGFAATLTGSTDSLMADCYVEEFLTEMFSCYGSGTDSKTLAGADLSKGPLFRGEMEYILFGKDYLPTNVHLAADLLYMVRVLFNSIYVFSNAKMRSEALGIATAIAAWTGVGVTLVQYLILEAWAMAESVCDVASLCKGESVPLYKNAATWTLSVSGISGVLQKGATSFASHTIDDVYARIEKAADDKVEDIRDAALSYLSETGEGAVESLTNMVLTPVESALSTAIGSGKDASVSYTEADIKRMLQSAVNQADNGTAGFAAAKAAFEKGPLNTLAGVVFSNYEKLQSLDEEVSKGASTAIRNGLNDAYATLFEEVKKAVNGTVSSAEAKLHTALDGSKENVKEQVVEALNDYAGTLSGFLGTEEQTSGLPLGAGANTSLSSYSGTAMSYKDYMKVFVFAGLVKNSVKEGMLTRAAKLMQVMAKKQESGFNMSKTYREVTVSGSAEIVSHTVKGSETYGY